MSKRLTQETINDLSAACEVRDSLIEDARRTMKNGPNLLTGPLLTNSTPRNGLKPKSFNDSTYDNLKVAEARIRKLTGENFMKVYLDIITKEIAKYDELLIEHGVEFDEFDGEQEYTIILLKNETEDGDLSIEQSKFRGRGARSAEATTLIKPNDIYYDNYKNFRVGTDPDDFLRDIPINSDVSVPSDDAMKKMIEAISKEYGKGLKKNDKSNR